MTDIEWESPSPDGRVKHDWPAILTALRTRPGEWALILENEPPSTATNLKNGVYGDSKPGEFDVARRGIRNRRCRVYARYVGVS